MTKRKNPEELTPVDRPRDLIRGEVASVLTDPLAPDVDALIGEVVAEVMAAHPEGVSADELTVMFYDAFMARAGYAAGGRQDGRFAAHRDYCQGRFIERFGDLLHSRPVVTQDDRNAARQSLWRLRKRYSGREV